MVTRLVPRLSGTAAIVQFGEPLAPPNCPASVRHVTCAEPVPPKAVPEREIEDAVVVAAGICKVNVSGGAGRGGGAGGFAA